jgi:hypothetical protein
MFRNLLTALYDAMHRTRTTSPRFPDVQPASMERPTLNELDAFYRNPSSLSPERLAAVERFVLRERVSGSARENYLKRRRQIEAAADSGTPR